MSRVNLRIAWLLLLLVPTVAAAQRSVDRSRGRTKSDRVVNVDRPAERAEAVNKRRATRERPRVREDKVTRNKVKGSDKRRSEARRKDVRRSGRAESARSRSSRVADRNSHRKPAPKKHIEKKRARRRVVKHGRVKHKAPRVVRNRRGASHVQKRHHRRPLKRYVYRPRRYHRAHRHGASFGFYIRVPSVRWHAGQTRRFVFRQVVSGYPAGEVEINSTFKRRIRSVRNDYVEVEFQLDRVELVSSGRFLGAIDRFPGDLRKVRAKIYRDGFVQFDRMLYVVGNDREGFELLSTRYCGGDVSRASYECLDTRSGEIDFYRERVHGTRYSRFIDLVQAGRAVPISLVPDEEYLGFQYVVGYGRSSDGYYSGSFDYSSLSRYDDHGVAYRLNSEATIGSFGTADGNRVRLNDGIDAAAFEHEAVVSYANPSGGTFDVRRQTEIRYLED